MRQINQVGYFTHGHLAGSLAEQDHAAVDAYGHTGFALQASCQMSLASSGDT